MQQLSNHKPVKLVTDKSEAYISSNEATFLKNYRIGFNKNQLKDGNDGGNYGVGTGYNSTTKLPDIQGLPEGTNLCVLTKNAIETNELYVGYWNSNGIHTIYVIDGSTLEVNIVDIGSHLNFSADPKYRMPDHRCLLRVFYTSDHEEDRTIKEKILIYTDGYNWQRWIPVRAAVATGGFDAEKFPYFKLHAPHYDRQEFINYAVHPPMLPPVLTPVAVSPADYGKPNNLVDKSIQIAYVYILTDGRTSTLSPYSVPHVYARSGCSGNDANAVRCLKVDLYAGSALVEKIQVLHRSCGGNWQLYDTIEKFSNCQENDSAMLGTNYWERVNPWSGLDYDAESNTISYRYCGDKESSIYSKDDALRIQNDLPIASTAITPAGDTVLMGNNKYFYDNFECDLLSDFEIFVEHRDGDLVVVPKTVNIKVYAYLSRGDYANQFVWKTNAESKDHRFGSFFEVQGRNWAVFPDSEDKKFNLKLGEKEGFICYLAGTSYYAYGKQYLVDNSGNKTLINVVDLSDTAQVERIRAAIQGNTGYVIQEFEFNVPAGNYVARLAGHQAELDDVYTKTSTYVSGIVNRGSLNGYGLDSNTIDRRKEIVIQACGGDVDTFNSGNGAFYVFVPWEMNFRNGAERLGRFIEGYVTEDNIDNVPVERVHYLSNHGGAPYKQNGGYTDHNGFYFDISGSGDSENSEVTFYAKVNCITPGPANASSPTFKTTISGGRGYYPEQNISMQSALGNYGPCNRVLVRGKIVDAVSGNGLSGVGITVESTQTFYSNAQGEFELIIHDDPYSVRNSKIFYNSGNSCAFVSVDNGCVATDNYNSALSACNSCQVRIYPSTFNKEFKVQSRSYKSLKEGGRYGVGIVGGDAAGRVNYVNNIGYLDVPSFLDYKKFSPTLISWEKTGTTKFPSWVKWVSFVITNNLNNKKYLQWVADKIDFLDVNGDKTSTANGAILAKISIQSLLDYNKDNNFSTVTAYQFVKGDRIRIYDDGNGKLFDPAVDGGFLEYVIRGTNFDVVENKESEDGVEDGKSLLIDYDSRLLALKGKCGFWIEIVSPRETTDMELYCETGDVYPVVDGVILDTEQDILSAYDSYFVNRKIIVPGCSGKTFTHPFVSSSITDYWGENCNSCGRIMSKDEKAEQTWYTDDVITSDNSVNEGRVNGLGTFRNQNRKQFKGQEWGGIVAMHAERGIIFFICLNDWFLTDYNQNYVKATAAGLLQVNLEGNLSDPHQKVGDNYGCEFSDTATIDFYDGLVVWQDLKKDAVLVSDYRSVADIASVDNKSYFINKFRHISTHNEQLSDADYLGNLFECSGCIDPVSKCYFLTFRKRRNFSMATPAFINNEREIFYDMQETIVFDLEAKEWKGFTGFTPEMYSRFRRNEGNELITFAAGGIYFHNGNSKTTNVFYGVKTEQVIEIVCIGEEQKDKLFQSIAMDSRGAAYFIDSITTSNPQTYSYLPISYLKKKEGVFYASLLRNTNVYPNLNNPRESNLIDGGSITGLWMKVRLVRDIRVIDSYSELNYLFLRYIPREKSKK